MRGSLNFILLLASAVPLPLYAADAIHGKVLYQSHCARCHRESTTPIKTEPIRIPDVLRTRRISTHRFVLKGDDLDDIAEYLDSLSPRR